MAPYEASAADEVAVANSWSVKPGRTSSPEAVRRIGEARHADGKQNEQEAR
jgi:hypothetical protein